MRDEMRDVGRLAAHMVLSMREYLDAARRGVRTPGGATIGRARLLELAEAFYASEELYAMEVLFAPRGKAAARTRGECTPTEWRERKVYHRVASFIASLSQTAKDPAEVGAEAVATALASDRRYRSLCRALGEAGYFRAQAG